MEGGHEGAADRLQRRGGKRVIRWSRKKCTTPFVTAAWARTRSGTCGRCTPPPRSRAWRAPRPRPGYGHGGLRSSGALTRANHRYQGSQAGVTTPSRSHDPSVGTHRSSGCGEAPLAVAGAKTTVYESADDGRQHRNGNVRRTRRPSAQPRAQAGAIKRDLHGLAAVERAPGASGCRAAGSPSAHLESLPPCQAHTPIDDRHQSTRGHVAGAGLRGDLVGGGHILGSGRMSARRTLRWRAK